MLIFTARLLQIEHISGAPTASKFTALGRLGVELVVPKGFKHHSHMRQVLLTRLGEGQDVIAIDLNEAPQHRRARAGPAGCGDAAGGVEDQGGAVEDVVM